MFRDDSFISASERGLESRLLDYLSRRLALPRLRYAAAPRPLLGGTEATILAFQLAEAPEPFDRPLVLRRFRPRMNRDRSAVEAGIHDAARAAGIETPACVLHEPDRDVLGGAFLLLEQVDGRALLGDLAVEALGSGLRPARVWQALRLAPGLLHTFPELLAATALGLAAVDADAVEAAIEARGGRPAFLSVDARVDRILRRIEKRGLAEPLAPALAWLAANRPPSPKRRSLIHGDLGPTNFLERDGEVCAVLDWSKALLAEPEAELGFLRASFRTASIAGLGSWNGLLSWPLSRMAARITARLEAEAPLDPERVRWFETLRALGLLASSVKRARKRRAHVLDASRLPRAICREIGRLTGTPPPRLAASSGTTARPIARFPSHSAE